MNNDRFDDALRRKLEEVNPPFQEKNWTQMRRFMATRGFPPSVWHSPVQWLQPALTTAAAAGLLVVSVWQYRANQTLNERIQTVSESLTQTVKRLEQVQTDLQRTVKRVDEAPRRSDTVYVVQRVPVAVAPPAPGAAADAYVRQSPVAPARAPGETPARAQSAGGNVPTSIAATPPRPNRQSRPAPANRTVEPDAAVANAGRSRNTTDNASPMPPDKSEASASVPANQPQLNRATSTQPTLPTAQPHETNVYATPDSPTSSRAVRAPQPQQGEQDAGRLATGTPAPAATENFPGRNGTSAAPAAGGATGNAASDRSDRVAENASAAAPANLNRLTPVQTLSQSDEQAGQWQRRLRRVRYRSPYDQAAAPAVVAAEPRKQTHPLPVRWRLGVGGDVSTANTGYGVYGELMLNDRFVVGAGVGQTVWAGDSYQTEVQFRERTDREFRREYPGRVPDYIGSGPGGPTIIRREVADISRTGRAVVVPLQVGYRLGIGRQWFLTPFAGANLSFKPVETVDFSFKKPFSREIERRRITIDRTLSAYSSWVFGFGLERKVGPLVAQLSPVASVPIIDTNGGLNVSSVGLRARVYYQF